MSCSSRPSPASVGRVAFEAKLTLRHPFLLNERNNGRQGIMKWAVRNQYLSKLCDFILRI